MKNAQENINTMPASEVLNRGFQMVFFSCGGFEKAQTAWFANNPSLAFRVSGANGISFVDWCENLIKMQTFGAPTNDPQFYRDQLAQMGLVG